MKSKIPYDVRQECLWIVRGQERREKACNEMRDSIINETSQGGRGGNLPGKPVEGKAIRLLKLEGLPEFQRMRAVQNAERMIGNDIENDYIKDKLKEGIVSNCKSGKKHYFESLGLDYFSKRDFYRRREEFIYNVANFLNLV